MADLFFSATVAARGLDAALHISSGQVLALIGPNGSGKSTIAGVIAGLVAARPATVRIGERTITDTERGVNVATCERRVGLLQQTPLLFPHMPVVGNVEFAARQARRHSRGSARSRAIHWLDEVGAGDLAHRRAAELSGGEAQRVAVARALASEPDVLVLDEPLTGLDVAVAASMRSMLGRLLASGDRTSLLITHDILDIVTLADGVAVLENGRVVESGTTNTVLGAPRSGFGARIAGVNVVRGVSAGPATLRDGAGRLWFGVGETLTAGEEAIAVFSPAAVAVYRSRPDGSPRNSVRVRIADLESLGAAVRVRAAGGDPALAADITPDAVAELRLVPGDDVWFTVKSQAIRLHPTVPGSCSNL